MSYKTADPELLNLAAASALPACLPACLLDVCATLPMLLQQDCILSADPDEVLPDPRALLITINREALAELREQQEKRRKALLAAGPPPAAAAAAGGAVRQQPAVGLMLCSKEWAGLELQHSGSWQLSLVYTDEQLRFFGQVGLWGLWCFDRPAALQHTETNRLVQTSVPRAHMMLLSCCPLVHRCGG